MAVICKRGAHLALEPLGSGSVLWCFLEPECVHTVPHCTPNELLQTWATERKTAPENYRGLALSCQYSRKVTIHQLNSTHTNLHGSRVPSFEKVVGLRLEGVLSIGK